MENGLCFEPPIDDAAVRAARGSGALDLALGEVVVRLFEGDRLLQLGFAKQTDYLRERLGIPAATGLGWAPLARGLAERPLLRRAVVCGLVSPRKALTVLRVAAGETEAGWVSAAMALPLYELERRVRQEGFDPRLETFDVDSVVLRMDASQHDRLDAALALAEKVMGPGTPRWMKLEAIGQEWLGEFGGRELYPGDCEWMERHEPLEARHMEAVVRAAPALAEPVYPTGAVELDLLARDLLRKRLARDEALGRALEPIAAGKLYRKLGYATLEDYVRERLLMSPRTARQRMWLERKMRELPPLREALREGRVPLSKALEIAGFATPFDVEDRIESATTETWQALNRASNEEQAQRDRAAGRCRLWGPRDALETIQHAIWSVQNGDARTGYSGIGYSGIGDESADLHRPWNRLTEGEALARIADHFVAVWTVNLAPRRIPKGRQTVLDRHGGLCAVPGCSRPAQQEHHIVFRSQGGDDELSNRVALCAPHHLRAIHGGYLTVRGRAGELLEWHFHATDEGWTTTGDDHTRKREPPREVALVAS